MDEADQVRFRTFSELELCSFVCYENTNFFCFPLNNVSSPYANHLQFIQNDRDNNINVKLDFALYH